MSENKNGTLELRDTRRYQFVCEVIADMRSLLAIRDPDEIDGQLMDMLDYIQFFANKMEDAIITKNLLLLKEGYKKCRGCKTWMKPEMDELGRFCSSCGSSI